MSTLTKTCKHNGAVYIAQAVANGDRSCEGCAAINIDMCLRLGDCVEPYGNAPKHIIWVRKEN